MSANPVLVATARVARAVKNGESPEAVIDARRAVIEAKLERAVREAIAAAPPLTTEQRQRIAGLLA